MPYQDLCSELFSDATATGAHAQGPRIPPASSPYQKDLAGAFLSIDPRIDGVSSSSPSISQTTSGRSTPARSHKRKRGGETGTDIAVALSGFAAELKAKRTKKTPRQEAFEILYRDYKEHSIDWLDKATNMLINDAKADAWIAANDKDLRENIMKKWLEM